MLHPLQRKIDALSRLSRWADALRGASIVVAALISAVAALAALDYLLRIEDRGVRIILTLSAAGLLVWTLYRFLIKRCFARRGEVDYARAVERAFPQLRNRLASSLQFLRLAEDDPTAGSPALRRAVIESTEADARSLDFASIVDVRRPAFTAALAGAICLLAAALALCEPELARIAVLRIVNPLGESSWPADDGRAIAPPAEPPALEALSIRLVPPAYSGLPPADSKRHIRALRGTRVIMSGRADRPAASAALCLESGEKIPARIVGDGRSFSIGAGDAPFVVERSEAYWIELAGRDGSLSSGERWHVQAVADEPPTVAVTRPAADLYVAPDAAVPIGIAAEDDLAVARIELAYQSNGQAERRAAICTGPERAVPGEGARREADFRWNLAPLRLQTGTTVTYHAAAEDYSGQSAESESRRLTIVSADELLSRIADRMKLIAAELGRARAMQQKCRDRAESARSDAARQPDRSDLDALQALEHAQREVRQLLANDGDGILKQVRALAADLEINRVENRPLRLLLASIADVLDRLERERLSAIARELAAAVKSLRLELDERSAALGATAASLAAAVENQNAVAAVLDELIGRIDRSDAEGGLFLQLALLLHDQQAFSERTASIGRRTLGRRLNNLAPQESAELADASAAQRELARRFDRLVGQVDNLSDDQQTGNLSDDRRVGDLSYDMQAAADQIELNRIGRAVAAQKRIVGALKELLGLDEEGEQADAPPGEHGIEIQNDRAGKPSDSPGDTARPGDKPGSAAEGDEPPTVEPDAEQTRARILRLWGELPPSVRAQFPQTPGEDFPPEYERMIAEYFRRLADRGEERGEGRGESSK